MTHTRSKQAWRQGLALAAIKTLHTAIWALLVCSILALPFDRSGRAVDQRADVVLRYLSSRLAGQAQQGDIWDAVRGE
jgi:ABC-type Fe3+ transport system permease subunit